MTMLTKRLADGTWDGAHSVTVQVPVGAIVVVGQLLNDAPTSSTVEMHPAITFRVPDGATAMEPRKFIFVKDGEPVGDLDHYRLIGSYFPETNQDHARHLFEVVQ